MGLLKRFGYYFGGFVIGTVILLFVLDKKEASCDYSPNARVLKNISTKEHAIHSEVFTFLESNHVDTSFLSITLKKGNVLFKESQTQLDSCKVYVIQGVDTWKDWKLSLQNCKDTVHIFSVEPYRK